MSRARAFTFVAFLPAMAALLLTACHVGERRGIPAGASALIDGVTEDIAAGRSDKLYAEAAPEWRATIGADENAKMLERIRTQLGRIESRAFHSGKEQQSAGGKISGHALEVIYQTTFERGQGLEKFTLLEREGRWLLAGYSVSSDGLR